MKSFFNYIFEQTKNVNKDELKSKIDNIDSQKFLKKIELTINDYIDDDWANVKEYMNTTYMKNHCGYGDKIITTLIQKIKHHQQYKLCKTLFEQIYSGKDNKSDENYDFVTSDKLVTETNIYSLIKAYAKSVCNKNNIEYDESKFENLLQDVANFDISGKVSTGKFEFLTSLFMQDLNTKNTARKGAVVCDINAKDKGLEYKLSGARIAGNKEEAKPLHPEVLNNTFISLVTKHLTELYQLNDIGIDTQKDRSKYSSGLILNIKDDELDKALKEIDVIDFLEKLSKKDNIFRKLDNITEYVGKVFEFGVSADNINIIVICSLIAQLPQKEFKVTEDDIKNIAKKYPLINDKGDINVQNFKDAWLILHLCNYQSVEKWDYMLLFDDKINTGNYKVIKAPETVTFDNMSEAIQGKAIGSALPCYGPGTNSQNHAPMIKIVK